MGRPFTASDEEILHAARTVISRRGPEAFSIAEVASEVGLSRAAIILRFKSTRALKIASVTKMVEQFEVALGTLPNSPSGDNLLRLAAFIGSHVHSRESSAKFFASYSVNVQDPELAALEVRRGVALSNVIFNVMPETVVSRNAAVTAFRAHLTGSVLAWLAVGGTSDSRGYVVTRTSEWLRLTRIGFDESVLEELAEPAAIASNAASTRSTPRRSKSARVAKPARAR